MTEKFYSFSKTLVLRLALVLAFVSLAGGEAWAQNRTISGTVKDAMGPVMAASVVVEGTTIGASTGMDGTFKLEVPASAKQIKVSYVGYDDALVTILPSQSVYEITLQEASTKMDEVVVVGYATVKRRDVVGSVSSVTSEELTQMPVASVTEAMTGRMAGVQVTSTEGDPDAEIKIRVRGSGSITQDSSPLYIVDGFPVESISDIPSSDIQSIDVLKDAFSTAIYGSRGANGVVIVTTKSGEKDRITVNYNLYYGFRNMANKDALTVQNPYDFVRTQYEYAMLKGSLSNYESLYGKFEDMDQYNGFEGTDWVDQVFGRQGQIFDHNISVAGGGEKYSWTAGYSHHDEKAIMVGSDYKRNNLNFKAQFKPVKRVSLDFNIRYSDVKVRGAGANSLNDQGSSSATSRLKNTITYSPIPNNSGFESTMDADDYKNSAIQPLVAVADNDTKRQRTNWNANAAFQWEIIDNLKLRVEAGLDNYNQTDHRFFGITSYYSQNNAADDKAWAGYPAAKYSDQSRERLRSTNTLSYDFKDVLNEDHNLNILVGQEYIVTRNNLLTVMADGFPMAFTSDLAWNFMSSAEFRSEGSVKYSDEDRIFSFFGRVNYTFKDRYMISATMRADGSSKFSAGNRWGYFPSAAASWRISGEEWMKGAEEWLDNLKIRYSFGTAGNNNIPSGQTRLLYESKGSSWLSMGTIFYQPGLSMPNPDLTWETTYSHNLGLDFSFWQSRLSGSVEVYKANTKDLLINFDTTGSGYNSQYRNLGEVENRGIEATINASLVRKQKWGIDFSANIAFNENKVVDLGGLSEIKENAYMFSSEISYDYVVKEGRPLGDIYGYVNDGLYTVDDFNYTNGQWILKEGVANTTVTGSDLRPGSPKFKDVTGDGQVTTDDITRIGNVQPLFSGGFSLSAYAYGFDLSANFTYSYGNKVYNANKIDFSTTRTRDRQNVLDTMSPDNRWSNINWETGELVNDPEQLAAMNEGKTMWTPYSSSRLAQSWAVEDASFLRLASLTIGYTIPQHLTKKIRLNKIRVYATGTNLFCWTPYTGYDPEVDTRRATPLTPNVDYSAYPKSRSWVFGINLSF